MRATFFYPAVFHHDDLIGGQNCREPMRDGDDGFAFGQTRERELDLLFALAVERGSRLVE